MRVWVIRIAVVLLLAGVAIVVIGALTTSDADRIEALVEEMRQAALRGDVDGVLAGIADGATFEGRPAPAMRQAVRRAARTPPRKLAVSLDEIEVDGDRATARAELVFEAEGVPRPFPLVARVEFVRRDGRWLVSAADLR